MGGRNGLAGISGVHTHMSNTRNTPVEAIEHYLPVRIRRYGLRRGSGGAGKFRGRRRHRARVRDVVRHVGHRAVGPPPRPALRHVRRRPGASGRNTLVRDGVEQVLPGKTRIDLHAGDRLRIESPGGGGYRQSAAPEAEFDWHRSIGVYRAGGASQEDLVLYNSRLRRSASVAR